MIAKYIFAGLAAIAFYAAATERQAPPVLAVAMGIIGGASLAVIMHFLYKAEDDRNREEKRIREMRRRERMDGEKERKKSFK